MIASVPESTKPSPSSGSGGVRNAPYHYVIDPSTIKNLYKSKVFVPDFTQPTMTLATFADQEMRAAVERARVPLKTNDDDFSHYRDLEEEELIRDDKARHWDDWKDDHPRGSGNKMHNLG